MFNKKTICLLVAATIAAPTLSIAALNSAGAKLISTLTKGELTPTQQFKAPMNLEGYVVKTPNGQQMIYFTDKSGKYLIAGNIIEKGGKNLTQEYTAKYINSEMAATAYKNLHTTNWVSQGKSSAPHKLYVLWDPDCSICHMLFGALQPMIAAGKVQVRWIPVAIRPNSKGKSAQILAAKSDAASVKLMKKDEAKFIMSKEQGGLKGIKATAKTKADFAKVKANTDFFSNSHFSGTPVILYKNKHGKPEMVPGFMGKPAVTKMLAKVSKHW